MTSATVIPEIGTSQRVPLASFIVDTNIRKDNTLAKEFVASVKQHGVIVPVDAYFNAEDSTWHLQDGQLRFLASMDAGHTDIPVLVSDPEMADTVRIQRQLILNERRNELTEADRVGAYQTLFDMGVSADQIARKTNTPAKRVQTALTVSASPVALKALTAAPITLDQAAAIAEFGDTPEQAETLTTLAIERPGNFVHRLEQLRVERDYLATSEALAAELIAAGYTQIPRVDTTYQGPALAIDYLYTDEKLTVPLAAERTDRLPADTTGLAFFLQNYGGEARPTFVIQDWDANGYYTEAYRNTGRKSADAGGGLTDEEKAARKVVRENNKLWAPASTVRRAWVTEFLQRKELPADALIYAAHYFGPLPTSMPGQSTILTSWLSIESRNAGIPAYLKSNPKQALNVLLAGALAAAEGEYDFAKDGWRRAVAKPYLAQLQSWGYTLSDIELAVVAGTADKGV